MYAADFFSCRSSCPPRVAHPIIIYAAILGVRYSAWHYCYLRTRLACLTRFSITPSNVSLSSNALSLLFSQYSRTSLAFVVSSSNFRMCAWSSLSVMFDNAARVVAHNIFVACKSSSGGDGGPFLFRDALVEEGWSTEADDVLSCFNRTLDPVRRPPGGD